MKPPKWWTLAGSCPFCGRRLTVQLRAVWHKRGADITVRQAPTSRRHFRGHLPPTVHAAYRHRQFARRRRNRR